MKMNTNVSYVCGTSDQPLIYQTIGEALDGAVERWGDKEAVVVRHQGIRWTYRQFGEAIDSFAAGLLALDLQPGDRVGIWSPNNIEWLITQFATDRAGLILVNINPAYRKAELIYTLNKVGCKALVLADSFKSSHYVGMLQDIEPSIDKAQAGRLRSAELPELR
jgi:fatty-acyl-CoA synthase